MYTFKRNNIKIELAWEIATTSHFLLVKMKNDIISMLCGHFSNILLSQYVPIQTVGKYMGHSNSTTTLQVYSHFTPDTKKLIVTTLNSPID